MDFQKVADAIEKSPQTIRDLIFSAELGGKMEKIMIDNNLEEEVAFKLTDEVGYVILGLKPRTGFSDSLSLIGISGDKASKIVSEVEANIFINLDQIVKNNSEKIREEKQNKDKNQSSVGQSFEQIILNQARAMQPARPPENLPIEQATENKPKMEVPTYGTSDPYREPIS